MALLALLTAHERLLKDHIASLLTYESTQPCDDEARLGRFVTTIAGSVHETLRDLIDSDSNRCSAIALDHKLYHAPLAWLVLVSHSASLDVVVVMANGRD